jgi:chromosome partitioning protein
MAIIYALANQKGGVGKTTSTINLAAYLADAGMRVLLVDIDPQSNATSGLGFNKYEVEQSTYHLLLGNASANDIIVRNEEAQLSVMPASPELAGAEVELVNMMAREYRLRDALEPIGADFDYILIDCPPSLSLLTINALTAASHGVVIPVQCEYLALEGLTQLSQTIQMVRQHLNRRLRIRGLVMTMYDARTNLSRQVVEEVRKHYPGQVFRAIIPRNVRLSEAPSYGQPISLYTPHSSGALGYKVLAAEIIQGDMTKKGRR